MPASSLDYSALTHIIHFAVVPNSNGTLNSSANSITSANSTDLVSRTHTAGRKVLICVGGTSSETAFQGATSAANLPVFISNLTNFMAARGYDGVDIDWEPLTAADANQYTNLVNGLRSALNQFAQPKLLTAAIGAYSPYGDPPASEYTLFARLQSQFDQLNIMTYDLSGPYAGWVIWFNSPIYDGGFRFPSTSSLVPSVDGAVGNLVANGVAPGKLGIGIAFYGYAWKGTNITQPRLSWTVAPTVTTPAYNTIMASYYQSNLYHWDTNAQAAYLSITNSNPANDIFLSYDDQRTCQSKVSYARNRGLGGVMIWELAQDYFSSQPAGQRNPMLQFVKQALATPRFTSVQRLDQDILFSFTTLPLASYRVLSTTNLASSVWNTLTSGVPGSGVTLQVTDPGAALSHPQLFYRIQTPP